MSSLGVHDVQWHTQILAYQFTLFQPGGIDYAHLITTGTPGLSDLSTALFNYLQNKTDPGEINKRIQFCVDNKVVMYLTI